LELVVSGISSTAFWKNWARLIQKIYQVNPLLCLKYQAEIGLSPFIDGDQLFRKILTHLGLWKTSNHNPPQLNEPLIHTTELSYDYTYSLLPPVDYWAH
jgi:hypothetical protein